MYNPRLGREGDLQGIAGETEFWLCQTIYVQKESVLKNGTHKIL